MGKIKWIGGGLGFVFGGPIGAVVGFLLGSIFDDISSGAYAVDQKQQTQQEQQRRRYDAQPGDFAVVLLILTSSVLKADGANIVKAELDYVKEYFKRQFGLEKTKQYILLLREILQKDYDLQPICMQVRSHMNIASRMQLVHYLFGVATADTQIHNRELLVIQQIAMYLGISTADFNSIKAMYIKSNDNAYTILEIPATATNDEIKKAYKRMAVKYHPDKVSHMGEDVRKNAEDKFKKINEAYNQLKKERGIN